MLAREEAEAVVRADYDKNQVIVWVRGRYAGARRDLLTVVRDHFAAIHGQIKGLNPQELVTVTGHPEVTVSFDDLLKDERDVIRTTRVTVDGKRVDVEIAELLNGVESPEDRQSGQRRGGTAWRGQDDHLRSRALCVTTSNNTSAAGRSTGLSQQS